MKESKRIHVGDYGFDILAQFDVDISAATSLSFVTEKPDASVVTWTAVAADENNSLRYVVESGDLDLAGVYRVQPKLTLVTPEGTTVVGSSNIIIMKVYPAITA